MRNEIKRRLSQLLAEDKEEMREPSKRAYQSEMRRIAEEYFELDCEPVLQFETQKDGLHVTYSFRARRARNFTTVK